MKRTLTDEERLALEVNLDAVKMHQDDLWAALSDLEATLNGVELSADTDYEGYTVDMLLEMEDDAEKDPDLCTCDERSWAGEEHDTACPLEGKR